MWVRPRKPNANDLFLLKECGYSIGDWVWIRPNSSDWGGDWAHIKLMVVSVIWDHMTREWWFECIDEEENDELHELTMNDLTKYNMWEDI